MRGWYQQGAFQLTLCVLDAVCFVYTCRRLIDRTNDCRYVRPAPTSHLAPRPSHLAPGTSHLAYDGGRKQYVKMGDTTIAKAPSAAAAPAAAAPAARPSIGPPIANSKDSTMELNELCQQTQRPAAVYKETQLAEQLFKYHVSVEDGSRTRTLLTVRVD